MNFELRDHMLEHVPYLPAKPKRQKPLTYRKRFTPARVVGAPRLIERSARVFWLRDQHYRFHDSVLIASTVDHDLKRVSLFVSQWTFGIKKKQPYTVAWRTALEVHPSSGRVFVQKLDDRTSRFPLEVSNRLIDPNQLGDLATQPEVTAMLHEVMVQRGARNPSTIPLEWAGIACRYPSLSGLNDFGLGEFAGIPVKARRALCRATDPRSAAVALSGRREPEVIEALLNHPNAVQAALLARTLGDQQLTGSALVALLNARLVREKIALFSNGRWLARLLAVLAPSAAVVWLSGDLANLKTVMDKLGNLEAATQTLVLSAEERTCGNLSRAALERQWSYLEHCHNLERDRSHPWTREPKSSPQSVCGLRIIPKKNAAGAWHMPRPLATLELPHGGYARLTADFETMLVFASHQAAQRYHPLQRDPHGALGQTRLELTSDLMYLIGAKLHREDFGPGAIGNDFEQTTSQEQTDLEANVAAQEDEDLPF